MFQHSFEHHNQGMGEGDQFPDDDARMSVEMSESLSFLLARASNTLVMFLPSHSVLYKAVFSYIHVHHPVPRCLDT